MRASRVDENQAALVKTLRECGVTVQHLHSVGQGCPDIICGVFDRFSGERRNYLFEIKDAAKVPSAKLLTPAQQKWHGDWSGQVAVVETADQALRIMGII